MTTNLNSLIGPSNYVYNDYYYTQLSNPKPKIRQNKMDMMVYGDTLDEIKIRAYSEAREFYGSRYHFEIQDEDDLFISRSYSPDKGRYCCHMYMIAHKRDELNQEF
jgi:hypothetical protein